MKTFIVVLFLLAASFTHGAPKEARKSQGDPYPIQLIYPSKSHEELVVNEESLAILAAINKPVAIVAVCGPLHSGKSFLMNQLLGRTSGFALGPTTEPQTRGLWMWNTPLEVDDHVIVFLDTEGLFASNISENYDAKIFAISNLLSSYLIYNSVKIIDQSAIDYIELLARRADLFMVKAELGQYGEASTTPLAPPKLLWIVQDFVSDISADASAKDWLNRLLAYRKKTENDASSLPSLFSDIDCFTLFLPEYRKEKLRYLDQISNEELLPDYKYDMAILRQKVIDNARVKIVEDSLARGGEPSAGASSAGQLNGAGAAALLRLLVDAANRGSFPEVPSLWNSFLQLQVQRALKDAAEFYESSFKHALAPAPMPSAEFVTAHKNFVELSKNLFSRLTFGFKNLEGENLLSLTESLDKVRRSLAVENSAKIETLCASKYRQLRSQFHKDLWDLPRPLRKRELASLANALYEQYEAKFKKEMKQYAQEKPCKVSLLDLTTAMEGDRNSLKAANLDLLLQIIANASTNAVAKTNAYLNGQDPGRKGLGIKELKRIEQDASKVGTNFFEDTASFALEDNPTASASRNDLQHQIKDSIAKFFKANDVLVEKRTLEVGIDIGQQLTRTIDSISLPQPQATIHGLIGDLKKKALQEFAERVADVLEMEPTRKSLERLSSNADKDLAETIRRNNQKYDRILADALPNLKTNMAPLLSDYWWPPNAVSFAHRAVRATLMQEELIENEELLAELSTRFVDKSLEDEIRWLWNRLYVTVGSLCSVAILAFIGLFKRSSGRSHSFTTSSTPLARTRY